MRIKNFKMFLESAIEKYLDADHFFYSYFINFYDEGYEFKLTKGWIDEDNNFRMISPGKNRKLGYKLLLENVDESKVDLSESLFKAQEMIEEIEGFKVINKYPESHKVEYYTDLILESDVINDLTIDDVCKEYPFITKDMYLKSDEFIKDQLKNSTTRTSKIFKIWYNDKNEWIIEQDLETDDFYIQYHRFWSFFETKFNLEDNDIETLTTILLESNLNCRVTKTIDCLSCFSLQLESNLNCRVTKTLHTSFYR